MHLDDLRARLRAPDISTRLAALEDLLRLPPVANYHWELIQQALEDREPLVRATAIDVALELKVVAAATRLAQLLRRDDDATVRACSAEALGELGDPKALPALIEALTDEDSAVRTFSANSLGLLQQPSATRALLEALPDEASPAVALNIRFALARLGVEVDRKSLAAAVITAGSSGHGIQVLNAVKDFLRRPRQANLSALSGSLSEALSQVRPALPVDDLALADELISKLDGLLR